MAPLLLHFGHQYEVKRRTACVFVWTEQQHRQKEKKRRRVCSDAIWW